MASISSTIKVTKVMQMIATAKIAKIKQLIPVVERYDKNANSVVCEYLKNTENVTDSEKYFSKQISAKNKKLIVVLSSDKGTCGGINTAIFKELTNINKHYSNQGQEFVVLPIGKKISKWLDMNADKFGIKVCKLDKMPDAETGNSADIALSVAKIIELYNSGEVNEVRFLYNKFKNIITCNVANEILLPLDKKLFDTDNVEYTNISESENTMSAIIEFFVSTRFYGVFISNLASIISSRMNAMDNATKNGQEIIDELKITYNKSRQAGITAELSDIVSGAGAIE